MTKKFDLAFRPKFYAFHLLGILLLSSTLSAVEAWPEFRGPRGDGHAEGSNPPIRWSEDHNIKWSVDIHGLGWSSPVVWRDQIWMTTATEDGHQMFAVCVDRHSGKIVHDILVFENEHPRFRHATNSYASPTPVVEDGRVYVHFGSYGTACLDTVTGRPVWERRDLHCDHFRGPGSSPILHDGRIYVAFDGFDVQYIVALDKMTGHTVWRKDRNIDYGSDNGDFKKAYSTCQVISHEGRSQLISPSAADTLAYDPVTGDELWRLHHGGMNAATRPVYGHGLVFISIGDSVESVRPKLLAVRPGGRGNITDVSVAWQWTKTPPKRPSPLLVKELLFMVSDDGIATCLKAATGEVVWRQRMAGSYRASPVFAKGRVYFSNLEGDVTVIAADSQYKVLATNHLDDGFQASPAIAGDSMFLRSIKRLYCAESNTDPRLN